MKKIKIIIFVAILLVFSLAIGAADVLADNTSTSTVPVPTLISYSTSTPSIILSNASRTGVVQWQTQNTSGNSFKIVWSKNPNPTFPIRYGDHSDTIYSQNVNSYLLKSFLGDGIYYARVCNLVGGLCQVYSNQVAVQFGGVQNAPATTTPPAVVASSSASIATSTVFLPPLMPPPAINDNAQNLFHHNFSAIYAQLNLTSNSAQEQQVKKNYLPKLQQGLAALTASSSDFIVNFITYGVDANTLKLGQGQRAAVVNSFRQAYGILPTTQAHLEDLIKIANGRWPSATSTSAEANAKAQFKKIYLRDADMNNPHDAAAIKIIAYGLQQQAKNRNLKSESVALKTFKAIFNRLPTNTLEWNTLAAITYSGSTR